MLQHARYQISRFFTGIEIHPGAKIGKRLFIKSSYGRCDGRITCDSCNNVTIYQGVTLGGTGKEKGREQDIGDNVLIAAGGKSVRKY